MYLTDLFQILDSLYNPKTVQTGIPHAYVVKPQQVQMPQPNGFGFSCPSIQRVTFNGDTTIVFFVDGTYVIVKCSGEDKYDKKTAVVYAIVKRMLGKLGKTDKNGKFHANEVDGNGFGAWLQNVVDNGFDQELEEKTALEKKRQAHAAHEARQKAERKAAFEKRVEARAKEILLERAATDRANAIEDAARTKQAACVEELDSKKNASKTASEDSETYVKPDKPFSKFTEGEKRAYWRYHNAKRKGKKS